MNSFRIWFLTFFLLFSLRTTGEPTAEQPVLSVESPGFNATDTQLVEKRLGISIGHPLTPKQIDQGIRSLYQDGIIQTLFVDTVTEAKGIRVFLRGERLRKLRQLKLQNLEPQLTEELQSRTDLSTGTPIDNRMLSRLKERILEAYRALGYHFAEVTLHSIDVPDSHDADLIVSVVENQPTRISRVVIKSRDTDENSQIRELIGLKKGDIFSTKALQEGIEKINRYLKSSQFTTSKVEDISLEYSADQLNVEIIINVQLKEKYQFEFVGNTILTEVQLRDLWNEEVLSQPDAPQRISQAIEAKYRSIGYHFCRVTIEQVPEEGQLVRVRFRISEGRKVYIDQIEFSKIRDIPEGELRRLFFQGAPSIVARHIYWADGVREAARNLQRQLESIGYQEPSVSVRRTVFSDDEKGAVVYLDVETGVQTYASRVTFEGNQNISQEALANQLTFQVGEPLNRERIDESRQKVLQYYQSQGYIEVKYKNEDNRAIQLSEDQKEATILFDIEEGPRYRIGEIRVEGNKKTNPDVIFREMKVKQGDWYDPVAISRSQEDIALLGLFSGVEIVPSNSRTAYTKDLMVAVRETRPGLGEVGVGGVYEDPRFRVRTFFGVQYRNVMGLNHGATGRAEIALPLTKQPNQSLIPFIEYSLLLGYRAPYLLGFPFTFATQAGFDSFEISPDNQSFLTRARLEEKIERRFTHSFTGLYRLHRFERTSSEKVENSVYTKSVERIGSTGPGFIFDFRDDIFNPSKGSYHTLDVEIAHPALLSQSDIGFIMAIQRNSFYMPLLSPLSMKFFLGGGYARSFFRDAPLPQARLLTDLALGGQGSIRGFTALKFQAPQATKDVVYYNARAELNIALFTNISGAIFFDTGQLYPDLRPSDRHDGIGIGIRYKTAIGPVVVDLAQGLGKDKETLKLYFTVGTF